jgi:hypothetical protein
MFNRLGKYSKIQKPLKSEVLLVPSISNKGHATCVERDGDSDQHSLSGRKGSPLGLRFRDSVGNWQETL